MKKIMALVVGFTLLTVAAFSEEAKYKPTEVQLLRLEVKQRDAQIAQKDLFFAQQQFQRALQLMNDEAAIVKAENNWPKDVVFNGDTLAFSDKPAEPAKK